MKVLCQYWLLPTGEEVASLHKDQESLIKAIGELSQIEEPPEQNGDPEEITIPETSGCATVLDYNGSIFLTDDEMGLIWDSPEYQTPKPDN